MIKFHILTIFPQFFENLKYSLIGKAIEKSLIFFDVIDIRDFSDDKNRRVDDTIIGGGPGMLMSATPIIKALNFVDPQKKITRILFSPLGEKLQQKYIENFNYKEVILICTNYEGIDDRLMKNEIDEVISIGDYILTGGEIAASVYINSISRYVDGVLGNSDSLYKESFSNDLLEYPQFTKPNVLNGESVPKILISGNHKLIDKWRIEKSLETTFKSRPDLLLKCKIEEFLPKK